MNSPNGLLLSILIPTYNRRDCLDLNLNCLLDQLSPQVEILIGNNASSDDTIEYLKKYENHPSIQVFNRKENLGADSNFIELVKASRGQFVWIFGDDEVLFEGALNKVLALLSSNPQIGILHIPPVGHASLADFSYKNPPVSTAAPVLFTDSNDFLMAVGINLSFITANIFNSNYLDKTFPHQDDIGSCLAQQSYYLQAALKAPSNLYYGGIVYSQLSGNTGGYKVFDVFGKQQQIIFERFKFLGLEDRTIQALNRILLKNFFPGVIITYYKLQGTNNFIGTQKQAFKILHNTFSDYLYFWVFCVPVFLTPSIFWRLASRLKKYLRKWR